MRSLNQLQGSTLPGWFTWLRRAQALLAIVIVVLTSVAAAKFLRGANVQYLIDPFPGFAFCWFAFAWTVVYLPVARWLMPLIPAKSKPIIFLLVLELLSALWWLVTFALLADASNKMSTFITAGSSLEFWEPELNETQASAVLGAAEFVLFCVGSGYIIAAMVKDHKRTQIDGSFAQVQEFPKDDGPHQTELSATREI